MRPRLRVLVFVAVTALATLAADGAADGAGAARIELRTLRGKIVGVDAAGRKITVETADGQVTLEFDRNTNVYLDGQLGTVRDLVAGASVRASFGAQRRAYWIEIQPRGD